MQLHALGKRLSAVLALQLALCVCSVLSCTPWQFRASWNPQSPLRIMSAHRAVTTPYRRIGVTTLEDADISYPLIAAYLTNPELAHSVEEFVSHEGVARLNRLHDPGADRLPFSVSESDHEAIREHVDTLGLPPDTVREMKGALEWWRKTATAWSSQPAYDPFTFMCNDRGASDDDEVRAYDAYASTAAALLLSLCPNISTLYLGSIRHGPLREYLLESNYGQAPRPGLQNLKHVVHSPPIDNGHSDMYDRVEFVDYFRYFHRLPRISSVSFDAVMEYQAHWDAFPPKTSAGITKMHFGNVDIPSDTLATLIRIPTGLEELSVSMGGLVHLEGGSPDANMGLFGRCLEQHKLTLKVLDLDLGEGLVPWMYMNSRGMDDPADQDEFEDEDEFYDPPDDIYFTLDEDISEGPLRAKHVGWREDHDRTMMVLHDYTALTRLSINIEVILGPTEYKHVDEVTTKQLARRPFRSLIDALPPSLEYLCLYGYIKGDIPELDEQVADFMARKSEHLPKLTEVRGVDSVERVVELDRDEDNGYGGYLTRPDPVVDWVEA